MSGSENKIDPTSDAPLTDAEFDAWWPFGDDNLDEYEREIVESLSDYQWTPPPHLAEGRRQARIKVRRFLADKYPDGIPGDETGNAELTTQPVPAADDA